MSVNRVVPLRGPAPVASVQGTLALDLVPRHDPPPRRPLALDTAHDTAHDTAASADVIPIDLRLRREVQEWARRYTQAAVEIVGGDRPVAQLVRWTSREVHDDLARRALLVARAGGHRPGQGRVQPVRPTVVGVHTCFLDRGTVEVSAHVRYGARSRAVAARFERRQDRWQCTALEFA